MGGAGALKGMVVALAKGSYVGRVEPAKVRILIGIIDAHRVMIPCFIRPTI